MYKRQIQAQDAIVHAASGVTRDRSYHRADWNGREFMLVDTGGIEFTSFAWYRTSELADLPLWMIHIAWPVAAVTWIVFLGEQFYDEARILFGRSAT